MPPPPGVKVALMQHQQQWWEVPLREPLPWLSAWEMLLRKPLPWMSAEGDYLLHQGASQTQRGCLFSHDGHMISMVVMDVWGLIDRR
jgi:hypothetical protein